MTRPSSELAHLFRALKAPAAARALPKLADRARADDWSFEQFAAALLKTEVDSRDSHGGQGRIKAARFPARKTLEEFDFSFQTSIRRDTVLHLGQLDFLAGRENVVLLGPPGTGKSHLAIAIGIRACLAGQRVAFRTATEWVALLADAQRQGRLDDELARLQRIPLLVVDEVGYIPFDPQAANLMFMLVSRRYERASLIVTSNKPFSSWGEIFGDDVVAAAMIDRLVHHAEILALKGDSYRLKDRDLDRPPPPEPPKQPDPSPSASLAKPAERLYAAQVQREARRRTPNRHSQALPTKPGPADADPASPGVHFRPALTAERGRRRSQNEACASLAPARTTECRPGRACGAAGRALSLVHKDERELGTSPGGPARDCAVAGRRRGLASSKGACGWSGFVAASRRATGRAALGGHGPGATGLPPIYAAMARAYARAMGARSSRRLAWTLGTVSVGLVAVAAAFDVVNAAHGRADPWLPSIAAAAVGFAAVGALIAAQQRDNAIGWMLLAIGVGHAISGAAIGYGTWAATTGRAGAGAALWLGSWAWLPLAGLPAVLLLFPTGRLRSRRLRAVLLVALALPPLLMAGVAVHPQRLLDDPAVENPFGIDSVAGALDAAAQVALLVLALVLVVAVIAMVARVRRADGDERAQLKWALLGGAALALQLPFEAFASPRVTGLVSAVLIAVFCASLGIAMLRHRLYDIDLVLNRTLVYGTLTACVVGVYAGAVTLLGALFETRSNLGVSLVATGIVAVLFSPLRLRLQREVDRFFYGRRDDPYAVVTQLARRLVEAAPEQILPTLVEELAAALKLPRVAIELRGGASAAHGRGGGEPLALALAFHGQDVGWLELARRAPGEEFTGAELRLFDGLARQIGVAAYAVALTGDLQRSRERLVTAREEERRRLRRDLHDGLGPLLAGISLQLGAACNLLRGDPDAAEALLSQLADEAQAAVGDVRRVVDDLRPPALDQLGLVPAIRQQAARFDGSLAVTVEASGDLADLPAAVEVAAFRIATEALTNVARHASATSCRVAIARDGGLEVEVRDDGRGLPAQIVPGVGLSSIRERTAELGGACTIARDPGGGTIVRARLPVAGP